MKPLGKAAAFAAAIVAAQPALASDKQDFATCDGRKHPGRQDDGMRGEASTPGYQFAFLRSTPQPGPVIAACTTALASPRLLPTQSLRRAHLLRARAVAYLEAHDPAKALADLDSADAAVAGLRNEPFYRRSMGVSIVLLRALAKAETGDGEAAAALAREAAAARPYAMSVQFVAAAVIQSTRPIGEPSPSPWDGLVRLEPDAAVAALASEAAVGNFAGVRALRPAIALNWSDTRPNPAQVFGRPGPDFTTLMLAAFNSAYAHAVVGESEAAHAEIAAVEAALAEARTPAAAGGATGAVRLEYTRQTLAVADSYLETYRKLVDLRLAVAEGRPQQALDDLVGTRLPDSPATLELLEALAAATPPQTAVHLPDTSGWRARLGAKRGEGLGRFAPQALIAPEAARTVIDYERSRPNILGEFVGAALSFGTTLLDGIDRNDGFRSAENPDGTVKVEFTGNTPSEPMVQEMTLLRAAELARAAGKAGFVVIDRKDYTRTLQMSRGGTPISSTPQGFKTELTIRMVDPAAEPARAFDAVAVIDALGPLYYQAAERRVATR